MADLDGDGRSEVIIGTGLGLLYVLDGDTGFVKRFFPMQVIIWPDIVLIVSAGHEAEMPRP